MAEKSGVSIWIEGSRPKTLPASLGPVFAGVGLAQYYGHFSLIRGVLAAVVALFLQVGTNFANDYSDGIRGTDKVRSGPRRLVGGGLATPRSVKFAALLCFGVAGVAGAVLALSTHWWLLLIGAACVGAGWFYTGGPKPYGYLGFGELFVFVFFGLIETLGTVYVQVNAISGVDVCVAVSMGLLITAILVANNLRDIAGDQASGKKTLAVRLGDHRTRRLYLASVVGAFVVLIPAFVRHPLALVALGGLMTALRPMKVVRSGALGRELIVVLVETGRTVLVVSVLLGVAFAL